MWERKPVLLLLLATACILVGTIITMVLPFAWINTSKDAIAAVKPYSPLELAGRDVYIREGCNNCHTQTVRPLPADLKRYGPASQSGEFVYDRPFLWGSRRLGPDLARIGGKYPDAWHYKHMESPTSMVPGTNMPAYTWLTKATVDPELTKKKMAVLGFPATPDQYASLAGKTEMDAMVAYLQKLGRDTNPRVAEAPAAHAAANPFAGKAEAVLAGKALYDEHCASCHGKNREGNIGGALKAGAMPDAKLFETITSGISDAGMPGFKTLGEERVWKVVTFLQEAKAP
jgi:cytochrome c oxidase cbb3-type subunit 2